MTKAESWSISIDRSCHIGPSRTSNCFDLNYPEDALSYIYILYIIIIYYILYILYIIYIILFISKSKFISKLYQNQNYIKISKNGQSNPFLDSIEAQRGE